MLHKRIKLFPLLALSSACVFVQAANADATWPELFKQAATPKADFAPLNVSYVTEITQIGDEDWGKLTYKTNNSPQTGIVIDVDTYPNKGDKEDIVSELSSDEDADIWCDDYQDIVGGPVELVSETDAHAIYSFAANAETADDKQEKKILSKTKVTVTVDKQLKEITSFNYMLTEPVKPMMIAKINTFQLEGHCASHDIGRPIVTQISTKVSGKAMGQSFDQDSLKTFTDFSAQPLQ